MRAWGVGRSGATEQEQQRGDGGERADESRHDGPGRHVGSGRRGGHAHQAEEGDAGDADPRRLTARIPITTAKTASRTTVPRMSIGLSFVPNWRMANSLTHTGTWSITHSPTETQVRSCPGPGRRPAGRPRVRRPRTGSRPVRRARAVWSPALGRLVCRWFDRGGAGDSHAMTPRPAAAPDERVAVPDTRSVLRCSRCRTTAASARCPGSGTRSRASGVEGCLARGADGPGGVLRRSRPCSTTGTRPSALTAIEPVDDPRRRPGPRAGPAADAAPHPDRRPAAGGDPVLGRQVLLGNEDVAPVVGSSADERQRPLPERRGRRARLRPRGRGRRWRRSSAC